ncbi:MAG: hypothetical protein EXS14_01690 [Planctomycetes bacterium]|nr:hypothetical protein [Planctomycetota bacterium]
MDAHLLPGFFSAGPVDWLRHLHAGAGALRVESLSAVDGDNVDDVVVWLGAVPQGMTRRAAGTARVVGSRALSLGCECFGSAADRVLVGVACSDPKSESSGATFKDVEMALMGVACAALAHESQGVVLIGVELGPVGAGVGRGTLAEQAHSALQFLGERVTLVIAAPDTALNLGTLPGFSAAALGNLTCWTRTS